MKVDKISKTIIFTPQNPIIFNFSYFSHILERSYEEEEADIQRALVYAESLENPVWTQIAILFQIPYRGGYNKALNIEQEAAFHRILDRMEHE
jgi:hypothetical protein